jgi:NAD dependent epimerase/dehydratase family enzyme
MNKLIIAAGTGFLGQVLVHKFKDKFDEIVILTRGKSKTIDGIKYVNWNAKSFCGWENELENATVIRKKIKKRFYGQEFRAQEF